MDVTSQTPLLDLFRRGEVAPDIRLLAAQGVLAPRAHEQLGLLVWLAADADARIRNTALATLARLPDQAVSRFLSGPDVSADVRAFFEGRGVQPSTSAGDGGDGGDGPLFEQPDPTPVERWDVAPSVTEQLDEHGARQSTIQRLSKLPITERVKCAMRGNREERMLLIRDPNKLVSIAVLASPRLTEQEVESYARMASVSEDVLRVIGTSRAWTKDYPVVRALAFNPKTPIAIAMGLVNRLVERDIKAIASDRNVSEPVKLVARKLVQAAQTRRH